MDEKFIDVDFIEDENVYYTAVQVAEMIKESVTTVRSWSKDDVFGELLDIKKVNGRKVYVKKDIDNLRFIKELREKNYSIQQTKDYISKKGFSFGDYDGGLIDQKDPLGFEALAIMISQKQDEKLEAFKHEVINELGAFLKNLTKEQSNYMQSVVDEITISVDDKLDKVRDEISKDLKSVSDGYIDTKESLKSIQSEVSKQKEILEEIKQTAYVSVEEMKKISYKDPKESKLGKILSWFK